MTRANSTPATPANKPAKPSHGFPLFAHAAGVWAKKIRGRLHYFGSWSDPDGALAKYLAVKDDLHAGRTPRQSPESITLKDIANRFLRDKQDRVESGELSPRTWDEYKETCEWILRTLGSRRLPSDLRPEDFNRLRKRMAERWGFERVAKMVGYVRQVFKHAHESELLDRAVQFGPMFKKPTKKTMRQHRAQKGLQFFTAVEIRSMLDAAEPQLKAMILLGVSAGLGNTDCGRLPLSALNLESGWMDFPRPKTGVSRRCLLWPETVNAIRDAMDVRPNPTKEADAGLVFVTKYGNSWALDSAVTHEMRKLLDSLDIKGHRNFYCLRHTFRTIADQTRDQVACDRIMGHARNDMADNYREFIDDARLRAVADYVRRWLFVGPWNE